MKLLVWNSSEVSGYFAVTIWERWFHASTSLVEPLHMFQVRVVWPFAVVLPPPPPEPHAARTRARVAAAAAAAARFHLLLTVMVLLGAERRHPMFRGTVTVATRFRQGGTTRTAPRRACAWEGIRHDRANPIEGHLTWG
ncbi:hypothetical protein GCM10009609_69330 [Pseudonocardia aurantiaca]